MYEPRLIDQKIVLNGAQAVAWALTPTLEHIHEGWLGMIELLFHSNHRPHGMHPMTARAIALFAMSSHMQAFGHPNLCKFCSIARKRENGIAGRIVIDIQHLLDGRDVDILPVPYPKLPVIDEDTSGGMSWLNADDTGGRAYREYPGGPILINSADERW